MINHAKTYSQLKQEQRQEELFNTISTLLLASMALLAFNLLIKLN